jgi:hypothetical protein
MRVSELFEKSIVNGKDVTNEKRWKQTSMSPEEAIAKFGKENVKVTKKGLRNGSDMVEVFEAAKGMWVIKNKDGKEKRFKNDQSPEAIAWKNSSIPKKTTVKLAAYSDAYWADKEDKSDDYNFTVPSTPIDFQDSDNIGKIVKDHFNFKNTDWEMMKKGSRKIDGTTCATRVIRVMYEVTPEDDMGVDKTVQDSEYIVVGRNPKKPKDIMFVNYGMAP